MTGDAVPDVVGRHFIYTYDNGWQYEMYVKNATTIDYRIHTGMVGGRWVKDQAATVVTLDEHLSKIFWTEPTGTSVAMDVDLGRRRLHSVIFFPRWVHEHPERTVCFQNDHLDQMLAYREAGPTYPLTVVAEFAAISYLGDPGPDDESVVAAPPAG